jgi:hypothetical protein
MKTSLNLLSLITLSAAVLLAGCGKTVVVTRGPQMTAPPAKVEAVDGIPFYVKHAYCEQKATWVEPQYNVQVAASIDGKPAAWLGVSVLLPRSEALSNFDMLTLQENSGKDMDVKSLEGCLDFIQLGDVVGELRHIALKPVDDADVSGAVKSGDLLLAANTAHVATYVDYNTMYYYNANRPVTGTSQIDVKLAADGTMTEGSGQVNDQTLSSITGVVSSAAAGIGAAALPLVMAAGPIRQLPKECQDISGNKVRFDFTATVHIYSHTHIFKDPQASEPACLPRPLATAAQCGQGCQLEITEVTPAPAKAKDAKPDSGGDGDKPPKPKPPKSE